MARFCTSPTLGVAQEELIRTLQTLKSKGEAVMWKIVFILAIALLGVPIVACAQDQAWIVLEFLPDDGKKAEMAFNNSGAPDITESECKKSLPKVQQSLVKAAIQREPRLASAKFIGARCVMSTGDPIRLSRQTISEYTDNEYDYAFQFPVDWKMKEVPEAGESGEMRVLLQGPICMVSTTISKVGKAITKRQFEDHPSRDTISQGMINLTVEQVYKKTSKEVGATRMVVAEKEILPSDSGVKFYISTLNFVGEKKTPVGVAGIHLYPFEKGYLINFVMVNPLKNDAKENETCTKVFNSFHLIGEKPQS